MSGFSSKAIILRRTAYLDYDLILDLLTCERGKVTAIAKNALKSKRRFAGILEPFSCLEVLFAGRSGKTGMPVLKEASIRNPFASIRLDIRKAVYASYWAEMVNRWMEEDRAGGAEIFRLLYYALDSLDRESMREEAINILFQIRFMSAAGVSPRLDSCSSCNKPIDSLKDVRLYFDIAKGGIVCDRCGLGGCSPSRVLLSKGALKQLSWLRDADIEKTVRIRIADETLKDCRKALEAFVSYHISPGIKSLDVLRSICPC